MSADSCRTPRFEQAKRRLLEEGPRPAVYSTSLLPRTLEAPPPKSLEGSSDSRAATARAAVHEERIFHSSRWSSGNFFFRDRVTTAADGIIFRKGALFGSAEEHISYRSIASFKVDHGVFLSNITVETAGGSQPIFINGLWKSDAKGTARDHPPPSGLKTAGDLGPPWCQPALLDLLCKRLVNFGTREQVPGSVSSEFLPNGGSG